MRMMLPMPALLISRIKQANEVVKFDH